MRKAFKVLIIVGAALSILVLYLLANGTQIYLDLCEDITVNMCVQDGAGQTLCEAQAPYLCMRSATIDLPEFMWPEELKELKKSLGY